MARLRNPREKGRRIVRFIREVLHEQGYETDTVEKTGRFVKQKDLFGLWDLIALDSNGVLLIQAKCNKKNGKWTIPYREFARRYPLVRFEIWIWNDRKGFEVLRL